MDKGGIGPKVNDFDNDVEGLTPERWQRHTMCQEKEEENTSLLKIA